MEKWELEKRIEKIIDRNCIEHPWEGTEVYKQNIKDEVVELIDEIKRELLNDFITKQLGCGGNTDAFIQKFMEE